MYLLTTTDSFASPSPALNKEKVVFYLLAWRGALSCHGVGVFSLYRSWHAPNGSSFNLASFGWSVILAGRTSQKSLGRTRKIGLFPSPHHQTIPLLPLTHNLTNSHIGWVQAGGAWASHMLSLHICPRSACHSCVCRGLEACLHGLLLFFIIFCGLFYNSLHTLRAGLPLILDFTFLPAHFLIAIMFCHIVLSFLL